MPVYNGMPYLKEAVKSILDQTYSNFEFIVVDDGSTDSSKTYLKSLRDKRVILLKNNKNLGLSKSLNKALKKASGDYIARMDADDISAPERLQRQLNFFAKNQSIDLCGSYASIIEKDGKKVGVLKYPTAPVEIKRKIILFNPIIHPSIMARRKFFEDLQGYRDQYDGAEDYDLLIRGADSHRYANIPQSLICLRLLPKRRSINQIRRMDRLDLKIKLDAAALYGVSPLLIYAIVKKLIFMYFLPHWLKVKITKAIKKS